MLRLVIDREEVGGVGAGGEEKGSKCLREIDHSYSLSFSLHNSCPKENLLLTNVGGRGKTGQGLGLE